MKSLSVRPLILCVQVVISTFPPGKEDVRVVSLLFSELAYLVDKLERFTKVGKREGLRDVVFLHDVPAVHLLLQ